VEDLYLYRRLGGLEAAAAGRSAEDELLDWFTDDEVKQALEDLPEQFRMAVLLADVEGFSYKEIAEILEVPVGTVMSRLYRGRRLLEEAMLQYAREHGYIREGEEPAKMRSRQDGKDGKDGKEKKAAAPAASDAAAEDDEESEFPSEPAS
jgi:hypothetical protein